MPFGRILSDIAHRIRLFARESRGNVAMMFALASIPLFLGAGVGVDLARAMIVKKNLSEALDAAGLAIGSTSGLSQTQMNALAQSYFNANYNASANYGTPATVSVVNNGQSVTVSTHVAMPTQIVSVIGVRTINVSESSTVVWGQTRLWVSLVLDNTGSMCQSDTNPNANAPCNPPASGTKIYALQAATHNLLTMLHNASANAGEVRVSIVPFVKDVNVGTSNYNASWIDFSAWDATYGTCQLSSYTTQSACIAVLGTWTWTSGNCTVPGQNTQSGCTGAHGTWTNGSCNIAGKTQSNCATTHGVWTSKTSTCSIPGYTTSSTCTAAVGTWTPAYCNISSITDQTTCTGTHGVWTWTSGSCNLSQYTTQSACQAGAATWTPNSHTTWNGCVTDRGTATGPDTANNYDARNTAPSVGTASSLFLAEQYAYCPQSLIALSYDWTALGNKVDAMTAGGSTNQTIGLVWGWHALTASDPLDAPTLPNGTSRYIIILSDGLNTQDRWYGNGSAQSTQVDDRMTSVCTAAKADGIIIYSVFVDIGGTQGNSTVLQSCASDSSKYFDLTSTSQIATAFTQIAQQITNLRVSR